MPRHIPFYSELLEENATTSEVLLYGLIEVSSFKEGHCFASSEYMAKQIGVTVGTVKNVLTKLRKRGWIEVKIEGNKRVSIVPLIGLSVKKKDRHSKMTTCGKLCGKHSAKVVEKDKERHARMTVPSRQNDARLSVPTDGLINSIINNSSSSNNDAIEKSASKAGNEPACRLKHSDFETDKDFEKAFYERNTICLGEH